MARHDEVPHVGADVAAAHASADPTSVAQRFRFDVENKQVVPRDSTHDLPDAFRTIQFHDKADGTLEAFVPALASGSFGIPTSLMDPMLYDSSLEDPTGWPSWQNDYFGRWDSIVNNNDYKFEIRKAIRYWKIDPMVFRCTKLLAQLANSTITINCEDESVKELIEMWFSTAMGYNFRRFFFLELYKTGFVPVIKTLVPYVPRNYKADKIPKTGESGNVDYPVTPAWGERAAWNKEPQAQLASTPSDPIKSYPSTPEEKATHSKLANDTKNAQKSMKMSQESLKAWAEYRDSYKLWEQAKKMQEQHLCSQARLNKLFEDVTAKQYKWLQGAIPGAYTLLDPMYVEIWGPHEMGWLREPYLNVSGELAKAILNPTVHQESILAQLPIEIIAQVRMGTTRVWLSPNICTIVTGDRQPYERYPTPICAHAFKALDMKEDLYQMDRATVKQVKSRILKVTIGNDTYPAFDPSQIAKVAQVFSAPGRNMTIFWNHTLELEWIEPNLDSMKDSKKYDHWNDEIRTVYGISRILTGTSETSGAASVMNFKGVEEFVSEGQNIFLEFLNNELKMLKASLGISAEVEVKFDRLSLQDEAKYMAVLNQAVLNGIIDHETAIETLKFHFPTIKSRMEKIKKLQTKDGIFLPQPSANNLGPGGGVLTGGAPAMNAMPGKNAQKKGTSQPKLKAKAKACKIDDDTLAAVVDTDVLDDDQRNQLAELFGTEPKWVMTAASYRKLYGEVDFTPPLPELTPGEMMAAMRGANKAVAEIDTATDAAIAEFKVRPENVGKRGPYVTDKVKADLRTRAAATVLAKYNLVEPNNEIFTKNLERVTASLRQESEDMPELELAMNASFICSRRWQKLPPK